MFAQIKHIASISQNYAAAGKFYEAVFGMRTSSQGKSHLAVTVGDGYLGYNINPRKTGRPARLDHFGLEVADVDIALDRIRDKYPRVEWLKRPSNRPFAGLTTHDPDGNVFDLSQANMANRRNLYTENHGLNPCYVSHFALRTLHPAEVATFYRDVFELELRNAKPGDDNFYVSDGHVTMVIMPWHITDYEGTGIVSASMDHIGFTVDNLKTFKENFEKITSQNPSLRPYPVQGTAEVEARLSLARKSCPLCDYHLADVDGIVLSASEQS